MTLRCCLLSLLLLLVVVEQSTSLPAEVHRAQKHQSRFFSSESLPHDPKPNLDANGEYRQTYPLLFSTHSTNPWSRSRRQWGLWPAATLSNVSPTLPSRTIRVSSNSSLRKGSHEVWRMHKAEGGVLGYDYSEDMDGNSEGGNQEARSCPGNLTFFDSLKYLSHECKGSNSEVAHIVMTVGWLMVLFYLLGSTASDYFSCTLEKLSDTLKLSPAVAGVTLLAIGNGAPDVCSSVAAFLSSDKSGGIGFSGVLGGALFITTVVSGTVALFTDRGPDKESTQKISMLCFVRDALFILASAAVLTIILLDGEVYLWEAASFLSVYGIYAVSVWVAEVLENGCIKTHSMEDPLLSRKVVMDNVLPTWTSSLSDIRHHHYLLHSQEFEAELEYLVESERDHPVAAKSERLMLLFFKYGIEWPLALPRRLTIPVIEEERWSRPFAVASCTLAPLFVSGVWLLQCDVSGELVYEIVGISVCVGITSGTLAFMNTQNEKPPQRFLWLWLGGGFFMSIVWFYLVADQIVTSLETLGDIFNINPAILGLTVLAWGNSIGDLVADLALACGSRDGVQIAISGCYAGPLFNIVVGLGISLVIACWRSDPSPLLIADENGSLFFIIGFLVAGLIWALVMMPLNKMRLSKSLGAGLLLLYCTFLVVGMCYAMGWISR